MLSDFPFTQSQTSPSLPTSDIYACLCLWAVHLHPCLTNNPFSLRCPSWGFSAQLCVIVFGLLTSFYPLVSIGLLSLCEVPLPGLEYSLHFYCLVFGWHPETVPGLLQDLKLSLFCHPPWAASLVFKVFVNAVYLFMKCESVVKSLVWLLSSLTVNFWWFPLCGRKCVCLKDNLYLSVKKFYNFGEDCQKIKMLPICVQVVCFVFCFVFTLKMMLFIHIYFWHCIDHGYVCMVCDCCVCTLGCIWSMEYCLTDTNHATFYCMVKELISFSVVCVLFIWSIILIGSYIIFQVAIISLNSHGDLKLCCWNGTFVFVWHFQEKFHQ